MRPWGKRDDTLVHGAEPYNAEPARAALAAHPLTPVDVFYSRNHGPIPRIDPTGWRLRVDGLVDRPLSLSLADLQERFRHRELVATLQCAGNRRAGFLPIRDIPGDAPWGPGATSTARWTGASLADVLAAAAHRPDAAHVAFEGTDVSDEADPPQVFGSSITMSKATAGEVLLAWAMNGEPLPAVHGGPVRVVVPGYIGARSVKWVRRVSAQVQPSDNYFQTVAYRLLPADADPEQPHPDAPALAAVAVNADILQPADGDIVPAGPVTVSGYAFAGDDRGIARVDVSSDGGRTWRQAELAASLGPWAWRFWHLGLDLPEGLTEILARAWDTSGAVQPEHPGPLWNPKGYANNSWARVTLRGVAR